MKIKIRDRILSGLSGLVLLAAAVWLAASAVGAAPAWPDLTRLYGPMAWWERILLVAAALCVAALGAHGIWLMIRRGREKGFVIQHAECGDVSISMRALESMAQRCMDAHQEMKVVETRIRRAREGVEVDMRIALPGGTNIPQTVNALQKQIKQYITASSGVEVRRVRVEVEIDGSAPDADAPVPLPPEEAALPKADIRQAEEPRPADASAQDAETLCAEAEAPAEPGLEDAEPLPADGPAGPDTPLGAGEPLADGAPTDAPDDEGEEPQVPAGYGGEEIGEDEAAQEPQVRSAVMEGNE